MRKYSPKFLPSSTFTLCVDKSHTERTKVRLSFDDENKLCIDTSDKLKFYINNKSLEPEQAFNKDTIKLLYNNGITFLGGEFLSCKCLLIVEYSIGISFRKLSH